MSEIDDILERLKGQRPVISDPEELTDRIMDSLPDISEATEPKRARVADMRWWMAVAASLIIKFAKNYSDNVSDYNCRKDYATYFISRKTIWNTRALIAAGYKVELKKWMDLDKLDKELKKLNKQWSEQRDKIHQAKLDEIYDRLVRLRYEMSRKLGLRDAVELGYCRMMRNCYGRDDVEMFREAVVKYLVPLADSVKRAQAERTGVPYPMSFADAALEFRSGNPVPAGTADDILEAGRRFYDSLSPETSRFFRMMLEGERMDVLAREGKEGGGYCTAIYDYDTPFIFANFNGTADDVETVTHEAGHAFADWINRKRVPVSTVWPTLEGCEVHSMSMEFFAEKSAEDFFGKDSRKFLYSHLAGALTFIPYGTMVDHFQHIVYEHPDMTPAGRHAEWKRLLGIYMPWLRLDGEIPFYAEGMGWQRQHHIYVSPFYYIDYCLAQTVALVFWKMIQEDPDAAWERYMAYTVQGGSDVFTRLLEKAGLGSPFDGETLRGVCEKAREWLAAYDIK